MRPIRTLRFLPVLLLGLSGCQDALDSVANKVEHPLPAKLVNKMKANDMSTRSPIMMRIFKEEGVLEVWKQKGNGRYDIIASYEICKWSGKLGPKFKEGDRQAPEGYYRIYPYQMNPNSSYYLSFNMGFPNSYDRSHNRTGSNLMVHGACSSAGCYSMTDEQVLEIYGFARDAFKGGQEYFIVEALPFRMTAENMARHRDNEHFEFWKMLKTGYDHFELTRRPPKVDVCERRYVFNQMPAGRECQLPGERRLPAGKHAGHPGIGLLCLSEDLEPGLHQGCRQVRPRGSQPDCRQRGPCRGRGTARRAGSRESRPPGRQRRTGSRCSGSRPVFNRQSAQGACPRFATGCANGNAQQAASQAGQTEAGAGQAAAAAAADVPVPTPNPEISGPQVANAGSAPAAQSDKPFWKIWSSN
jgi:murein L,D-transpeptidase YafK